MADIFVSYTRADQDWVRHVVALLEAQGWSVWWDRRIHGGERWDEVIEREITTARCVVVVWTPQSITREWVREEADHGRDRGILVPILADIDKPPFGFGRIQARNLSGWDGSTRTPAVDQLLADVGHRLASAPGEVGAPRPSMPFAVAARRAQPLRWQPIAAAAGLAVVVGAAVYILARSPAHFPAPPPNKGVVAPPSDSTAPGVQKPESSEKAPEVIKEPGKAQMRQGNATPLAPPPSWQQQPSVSAPQPPDTSRCDVEKLSGPLSAVCKEFLRSRSKPVLTPGGEK